MSSQEIVDKLRIMAESPTYAMRRGVLLIAAQNLEVMKAEIGALRRCRCGLEEAIKEIKQLKDKLIRIESTLHRGDFMAMRDILDETLENKSQDEEGRAEK